MVRAVGLLSLATGFLMISPKFRYTAWDQLTFFVEGLDKYSPYSYVGLGMLFLVAMIFLFKTSAAQR